jgi:hypothetical protein
MNKPFSIKDTIVKKTDQLNAEDLLDAPMVIKITKATKVENPEQPIILNYDGDKGKPFKPCKTMRRLIHNIWIDCGDDIRPYVGRSMKLYCDRDVKLKGEKVGGTRISHMSDTPNNASRVEVSLPVARGMKKTFVVERLDTVAKTDTLAAAKATLESAADLAALIAAWGKLSAAEKTQLASVKDARKQQIESAAPAADDKSEETL